MSVAFRSIFFFIYTVSQVTCNGRNKSEYSRVVLSSLTCHMCRCPVPGRPHQAEGDDACGQLLQVPVSRTVCWAPVQSCLQGGASANSSDLNTQFLFICPQNSRDCPQLKLSCATFDIPCNSTEVSVFTQCGGGHRMRWVSSIEFLKFDINIKYNINLGIIQ